MTRPTTTAEAPATAEVRQVQITVELAAKKHAINDQIEMILKATHNTNIDDEPARFAVEMAGKHIAKLGREIMELAQAGPVRVEITPELAITEQSKALFIAYVKDAPNWSGTPLVGGNVCLAGEREDRGNLTQLKKAGLVTTWTDEGCTWLAFTDSGKGVARRLGLGDYID